jgi:DNA-binding MarR family transcriptional regulator
MKMTGAIGVPGEGEVEHVRRGVIHLARRLRAERSEDAMSSGKLSILGHLIRRGPMTPGELAAAEFVKPQSLTRVLAELEGEGLAARRPHGSDGRRSVLAITDAGYQAVADDVAGRDRWLAVAMGSLSEAERGMLVLAATLMDQLADDAEPPGGSAASGKPEARHQSAD